MYVFMIQHLHNRNVRVNIFGLNSLIFEIIYLYTEFVKVGTYVITQLILSFYTVMVHFMFFFIIERNNLSS